MLAEVNVTIRRFGADPLELLNTMMLIRMYEERAALLQRESGAPGTCTAVGQEATAVGVVAALGVDDLILTNHRSAGHLLARGASPSRLLAEALGRRDGYCGGKSGSLHVSARDLGVVLTSTIVGGELALATGVALSQQMLGRTGVVACFFGDGAACEGRFHESLNLAAVWRLPILYVCENNEWQAFVHRRETMLTDSVAAWAQPYGIDSATVDGNDVEAVRAAATEALASIRKNGRPFLLEAQTYRLRGHFEPDDQGYVDQQELASWRLRDPLPKMQARLLDQGIIDQAGLDALSVEIAQCIDAAAVFAIASPYPAVAELHTDIFA